MSGFNLKFVNDETNQDWIPNDNIKVFGLSSIKRRVESKIKGEAGLVGYDSVGLTLRNNGVVADAFNGDLSSVEKYVFEVNGIKSNGINAKCFEGMADFRSIKRPDMENKIKFDVIDKLKSFDILAATFGREKKKIEESPSTPPTYYVYSEDAHTILITKWVEGSAVSFDETAFGVSPGIILCTKEYDDEENETALITSVYWDTRDYPSRESFPGPSGSDPVLVLKTYNSITISPLSFDFHFYFYGHLYRDTEIRILETIEGRSVLTSYDIFKILDSIVLETWPDLTIINRTGFATYPIGLDYYTLLINELPFGKHPYEALKLIADSIRSYVFFDRSGNLIIQRRTRIGTDGTLRSLNLTNKRTGSKDDFWDKLIDGATVTIKSGKTEEGVQLVGIASVQKNPGIKPRNELKMEMIAPSTVTHSQDGLNSFALQEANYYMEFYGKRHSAYQVSIALYDDVLDWELIDRVAINGITYFFETIEIDLFNWKANFGLVEIAGHDYDRQQVHLALSKENFATITKASGSASTTSGSSGTIIQQNAKPLPLKEFDYSMVGQSNIKVANVAEKDFVRSFLVSITSIFNGTITEFRLYDESGTLFTVSKIIGRLGSIVNQELKLNKRYPTGGTILLEIIGTGVSQGAGFIVVDKYNYEVVI